MDFNFFRKVATRNQEQSSVHHVSNPVISSDIIIAEPEIETAPHDSFTCMYCLDKDQYRQFIFGIVGKVLADKRYRDATPYLPDWPSFKRHMIMLHPEQWGYYLLSGEAGPHAKKSWTKSDMTKASEAYVQIRAQLEYGWNFFVTDNTGQVHKTLHSLPKNEATIASVTWHPRANSNGLPWNDWRYEREGETHTRAQNLVPTIVRRSMPSVTQILRGARPTVTAGHTLEANPKRLAKYAHLPEFVNTQCLFTERALQRVLEIREEHNLPGAGNIGILLHDKSLLQGKPLEAKGQEEPMTQKEETPIESTDEPVILDDLWDTINNFMPSNDYTAKVMVQLHDIFKYVKAQESTTEVDADWKAKYEAEHVLVAGLRSDVAEAVADSATKTKQLTTQIEKLQSQLDVRGRNKSANEVKSEMAKATEKTLEKIKNEPSPPRRRRYI